jgi:hypothetical protein
VRRGWGGNDTFDITIPRRDRGTLMNAAKPVIDWTDRSLAHIQSRQDQTDLPTFNDLDAAIVRSAEIFNRYQRLLTGVNADVSRVALEGGWTRTFDRPLFPPPPIIEQPS